MQTYLVLVGSLNSQTLSDISERVGGGVLQVRWLSEGKAVEVALEHTGNERNLTELREEFSSRKIDVFYVSSAFRRKKLLIADMDATIVTGETLDDLAALAGLGEEIAKVTAAAMRGELDFEEALKMRVSKLKGLSESLLHQAFERMTLSTGAETLVRVMRLNGATCVLVSGGFTFFTSRVAEICGFSFHHGNILALRDGVLTGEVIPPILDKAAKLSFLKSYIDDLEISSAETLAVGDGANDLPMLLGAGLGVGYRPKPLVRDGVFNSITHSDLLSILYMQGYSDDEIAPYIKN